MSPSEMAGWARRVEDAGFESVWVTEAWWDAATVLALVAEAASRIRSGAAGEQMMRLAGRLGDGFIGAALNSAKHYDEVVIPRIEAGLAEAGRARNGFEIATVHITSVHEDRDEARRRARPHVGLYM